MARSGLFGARPVGAVTVVETPVSLSYARKARIAFLGVGAVAGAFAAAVLAVFMNLLVALFLGAVAGVAIGFVTAAAVWAWPVSRVLWWWSIEIALFGLVVGAPAMVARVSGHRWLVLVLLVMALVACCAIGPVRRCLSVWSWCVVVRHRLRMFLAECVRSGNRARPGSLPLVLWARPTPAGERAWLWLRPGLELADLEGATGRLAVACWAGEARVVRASTRYAALIRVDVARRDPLMQVVTSPLAALIPQMRTHGELPASPAVPPVGLELADVPAPVPEPRGGRR